MQKANKELSVNPRVDIVFKKIFGVEENKDLLISLINSIVSESDQVADVSLLNPYNPQNFMNEKLSILDIKARGLDGKMFNIEIQITDTADYDKRALYYWAKLYTEQLQRAQTYSNLSKAVGIHILNFISIPEAPKYHNVFHITERDNGFKYFTDLELHTIELNKFADVATESLKDILGKVKSSLDIWAAFLTRHNLMNPNNLPVELDGPNLRKALTILEIMNFSREERQAYEDHFKWLLDEDAALRKATDKGIEIGRSEGIEMGKAEGIEMGKAEGIEMGRAEGIEMGKAEQQISIVKNMLQEGISIAAIAKCSGLTEKQVQYIASS